ncbi:MAG TPA: hypothetical protein VFQ39_04275, partial [Longimicrobium sp.]|nr:hypothetical protein [Longimicrobium sp.]
MLAAMFAAGSPALLEERPPRPRGELRHGAASLSELRLLVRLAVARLLARAEKVRFLLRRARSTVATHKTENIAMNKLKLSLD